MSLKPESLSLTPQASAASRADSIDLPKCVSTLQKVVARVNSSPLFLSSLELSDTKSLSLTYEPSLEQPHNSAKYLFSNRELHPTVQLSVEEFSE